MPEDIPDGLLLDHQLHGKDKVIDDLPVQQVQQHGGDAVEKENADEDAQVVADAEDGPLFSGIQDQADQERGAYQHRGIDKARGQRHGKAFFLFPFQRNGGEADAGF